MRNFLKMFLAALLALIVFSVISFFFFIGWVAAIGSASSSVQVGSKAVLVVDLAIPFQEKSRTTRWLPLGWKTSMIFPDCMMWCA